MLEERVRALQDQIATQNGMSLGCPHLVVEQEFEKDLKQGDVSTDIVFLQRALNSFPSTTVAISGPGSRGFETGYFGKLTEQSIKIFQEMCRDTILEPAGLFMPTGVVGPQTRRVLNSFK